MDIIAADPLYQHRLLTAERKFWRCVESGALTDDCDHPLRRIATVRSD
jgi:hypothetical protein